MELEKRLEEISKENSSDFDLTKDIILAEAGA
jgi:hypothetical protein